MLRDALTVTHIALSVSFLRPRNVLKLQPTGIRPFLHAHYLHSCHLRLGEGL
jgi:hypothetical protein